MSEEYSKKYCLVNDPECKSRSETIIDGKRMCFRQIEGCYTNSKTPADSEKDRMSELEKMVKEKD